MQILYVMHELPDPSRLSVAEKDALLFEQLQHLPHWIALVQALSARVCDLEGRLHTRTVTTPVSGRRRTGWPKSRRPSCGRQLAGHAGTPLKRVANPEVMVQHPLPEHCEGCGAHFETHAEIVFEERRQVFDLIKPVLQVTEHRGYEARCRCGQCHRSHRSRFPDNVSAPVLKSALVYLTQQPLLPIERTAQILSDLFGVKLSAGSVQSSVAQAAQTLAPGVERIALAAYGGHAPAHLVWRASQARPDRDGRFRQLAGIRGRRRA